MLPAGRERAEALGQAAGNLQHAAARRIGPRHHRPGVEPRPDRRVFGMTDLLGHAVPEAPLLQFHVAELRPGGVGVLLDVHRVVHRPGARPVHAGSGHLGVVVGHPHAVLKVVDKWLAVAAPLRLHRLTVLAEPADQADLAHHEWLPAAGRIVAVGVVSLQREHPLQVPRLHVLLLRIFVEVVHRGLFGELQHVEIEPPVVLLGVGIGADDPHPLVQAALHHLGMEVFDALLPLGEVGAGRPAAVGLVDQVEPLDAGVVLLVEEVLEHVADEHRPAGVGLLDAVGLEFVRRRVLAVFGRRRIVPLAEDHLHAVLLAEVEQSLHPLHAGVAPGIDRLSGSVVALAVLVGPGHHPRDRRLHVGQPLLDPRPVGVGQFEPGIRAPLHAKALPRHLAQGTRADGERDPLGLGGTGRGAAQNEHRAQAERREAWGENELMRSPARRARGLTAFGLDRRTV